MFLVRNSVARHKTIYEPAHEILDLITELTNRGSDKTVHLYKAISAHIPLVGNMMIVQTIKYIAI